MNRNHECRAKLTLVIVCALLAGCTVSDSGRSHDIASAVEAIVSRSAGEESYDELLELGRRYPDNGCIAMYLGRTALQQGRHDRAEFHLRSADNRGVGRGCPGGVALLSHSWAELAIARGDYGEAVRHANAALAQGAADDALLVKAHAAMRLGDAAKAVASFASVVSDLSPADFDGYSAALMASGELTRASTLLEQRRQLFGYSPGQGVIESWLYQQLGDIGLSVASALMEIEHLRYHQPLSDADVFGSIERLRESLDDWAGPQLLRAYAFFVNGRWEQAAAGLQEIRSTVQHDMVDYLWLVSRLRSHRADNDDLGQYTALEAAFRWSQFYYYHLWRILGSAGDGYSILTARELLEHAVLLSPGSKAARASRIELGRLLGLSPAESKLLLLGEELDALARRAVAYRDPRLLDAIIESLQLPDTIYTLAAMLTLQRLAQFAPLRHYLVHAAAELEGTAADRLREVLGSYRDSD
ncbi:MAG: hypothetical protein EA384_07670 [Spirochaetaceae bacterium]|nr:MAG: hypothetical protein EA384_07670 [Spirochaetaceae bacterium]